MTLPYVIIGSGPAALVNVVTLLGSRWGRARLSDSPILVVDGQRYWESYVDHPMGQWPFLLVPPGFAARPETPRVVDPSWRSAFLSSDEFASWLAAERGRIEALDQVEFRSERVRRLLRVGRRYELQFATGATLPVAGVDLCVGPGAPRVLTRAVSRDEAVRAQRGKCSMDPDLYDAYAVEDHGFLRPRIPSPSDAPVVAAQAYLRTDSAGGRRHVLVVGAGPLAMTCCELALERGADRVTLVAPGTVHPGFPPSRRYDGLARYEDGTPLPGLRTELDGRRPLFPADDRVTFVEGLRLVGVRRHESGGVDVECVPTGGSVSAQSSGGRRAGAGTEWRADQVVVSASSVTQSDEPGSCAALLEELGPLGPIQGRSLGRAVLGARTDDDRVRVLGAAGLRMSVGMTPDDRLEEYQRSLPRQAHVMRLGLTLSMVTVAHANRYFDDRPDSSLNTAHERWLRRQHPAADWIDARSTRAEPMIRVPEAGMDDADLWYRPPTDYERANGL